MQQGAGEIYLLNLISFIENYLIKLYLLFLVNNYFSLAITNHLFIFKQKIIRFKIFLIKYLFKNKIFIA